MSRRTYPTAEAKWWANVVPAGGGHLVWTGRQRGHSGTPVFDHHGTRYTAARVGFRVRYGRDPEGVVQPGCNTPLCVWHVTDTVGRNQERAVLRELRGYGERPSVCPASHDQAQHGRLDNDGHHYCNPCNQRPRQRAREAVA
jgi:hypothetical protein